MKKITVKPEETFQIEVVHEGKVLVNTYNAYDLVSFNVETGETKYNLITWDNKDSH